MAAFTRSISNEQMVHALNDILRLTYDVAYSYDTAIEQSVDPDRHVMFRQLQGMHERHTRLLSQAIHYLGGSPVNHTDWRSWITRTKAYLAGIGSEHELLWAVHGNEQKLRESIRDAIREFATSEAVTDTLSQVLDDNQEYQALKEVAVGRKSSVTGNYR